MEDRKLLSTTDGGQWTHAARVTYSFVPDGTSIGGISSNLYRTMNADYSSTAAWQQAFEKAAAVWQQVANVNLAQVPDNGSPIGVSGDQQDDSRFGDIRIGAYSQQNNQLALTLLPPPVNGGTDAGDIFFNSSQSWGGSGYDLETVAIHEIGHALGMGHSQVQQAVMDAYYNGVDQSLTSDDTGGIQALYGPVPANSTSATPNSARNITPYINGNGQVALPGLNIASSTDNNWYSVTVPSNTNGTMVVAMQSNNLSSLSPRLAVFNANMGGLGQSILPNSFGATASVTITNVKAGQVYYIRASAANSGPGSDGAYGLLVNFGSQAQAPIAPPNTVAASQPDQGSGSSAMQTTSSNSLINLNLGLKLGNVGLNLNVGVGGNSLIDLGVKVQIGTLSAWGDPLTTKPGSTGHLAHHASEAEGPGGHHGPAAHHDHGHHPHGPAHRGHSHTPTSPNPAS